MNDTDQVVHAVDAIVASGKRLTVPSGGHCTEGLVDDPSVQCVIDLGQMDSVYYDRQRRDSRKLQEVKRRWDPHQVFEHALSVEPGREPA